MIITARNGTSVLLKGFEMNDTHALLFYFGKLSPETKARFGPHAFDRETLHEYLDTATPCTGYIAINTDTSEIVAYSILKRGWLTHDSARLQSYHLNEAEGDYTFAPSVADDWQSCGIGNNLFNFIVNDLKQKNGKRIFLWGGVQSGNQKAVSFYYKNGFRILGSFNYNGENFDMCLDIE